MIRRILLSVVPFVAIANAQTLSPSWSLRAYPAGPKVTVPAAITLDSAGNSYVVGTTKSANAPSDGFVTKVSPQGKRLWYRRIAGSGPDVATDVVVDGGGNVYVIGAAAGTGVDRNGFIVRFNPDGTLAWRTYFADALKADDTPERVRLHPAGGVVVVGQVVNGSGNKDILSTRVDATGAVLWRAQFDGGWHDDAADVYVAGNNTVFVAGSTERGTNSDMVLLAYNATGKPVWTRFVGEANNVADQAVALDSDRQGYLVLAGRTYLADTHWDYEVTKFDRSGNQQWTTKVGPTPWNDLLIAMTVAPDRSITLVGTAPSAESRLQFSALRLSPSGSVIWNQAVPQAPVLHNDAVAAVTDSASRTLVVGTRRLSPYAQFIQLTTGFVTFGANGGFVQASDAQLGPRGGIEEPTAMTIGPDGSVYITYMRTVYGTVEALLRRYTRS